MRRGATRLSTSRNQRLLGIDHAAALGKSDARANLICLGGRRAGAACNRRHTRIVPAPLGDRAQAE